MGLSLRLFTALLGLSLAGCSNIVPVGGAILLGDKKQDPPTVIKPELSFAPSEKPAQPASVEDVTRVLGELKKAAAFIPEDPAFMRAIILGDKVRDIFRGSQERSQALNKLSSEGLIYLARIARDCQLAPATRKDTGLARPGNTFQSVLSMSGKGPACDYIFNKSLEKNVIASKGVQDPQVGVYRWTENQTLVYREQREILNTRIRALSNIRSLEGSYQTSGHLDFAASNKGYDISGKFRSTGSVKIEFNQGEILAGPFYSESTLQENKTTTSLRFEGRISGGDILIIALRDAGMNTSPGTLRVFINGEPAANDVLSFFGLTMLEAAAVRE